MWKYLKIQYKRLFRILPGVLCVVWILFGAMALAYRAFSEMNANRSENQKVRIGLVGTVGDAYLELGLAALETLDSIQYSVEIEAMEEKEAMRELEQGDLPAYVVLPEGFMEAALRGDFMPIKYVSTGGAVGVVSMFKDEITKVIGRLLVEAQKGVYGTKAAMLENGLEEGVYDHMETLGLDYVDFVLNRSKVYRAQELGFADALGFDGYLFCGLSVLFLLLTCMPFALFFIRKDLSLERMLMARGIGSFRQSMCDFAVYLSALLLLLPTVMLLLSRSELMRMDVFRELPSGEAFVTALRVVPVIWMAGAFSFLLYSLTGELLGGVMLQFLATLALCFLSGCLFPVTFFPETVQKLTAWLPTGIARVHLAECLTGDAVTDSALKLLGYGALFLILSMVVRHHRAARIRG